MIDKTTGFEQHTYEIDSSQEQGLQEASLACAEYLHKSYVVASDVPGLSPEDPPDVPFGQETTVKQVYSDADSVCSGDKFYSLKSLVFTLATAMDRFECTDVEVNVTSIIVSWKMIGLGRQHYSMGWDYSKTEDPFDNPFDSGREKS